MAKSLEIVNVLLVDNEDNYAWLLQQSLHSFHGHKFQLTRVHDAEAALEKLTRGDEFDIVVTEYHLSGKNGVDLSRTISEKKVRIPIILITDERELRVAVEAMKFGVEEYLIKDEAVDTALPRTILAVLERSLQSHPGMASHHYRVADSCLFEEFHVGRVMPWQAAAFADCQISIHCDDADDH